MDARTALTALGAGVTTALLVAVAVVELVQVEFSALLGVPIGTVAGIAVLAVVVTSAPGLSPTAYRLLSAYATLGLVVLAVWTVAYASHGGPVDALSAVGVVAVGAVAAALAYAGLWLSERGAQPRV